VKILDVFRSGKEYMFLAEPVDVSQGQIIEQDGFLFKVNNIVKSIRLNRIGIYATIVNQKKNSSGNSSNSVNEIQDHSLYTIR
jgi:hypothetical protein